MDGEHHPRAEQVTDHEGQNRRDDQQGDRPGQRLGDQSADYTVTFDTQKGQKSYSPSSLADFARFRIGTTWALKLNAFGGIVSVGQ